MQLLQNCFMSSKLLLQALKFDVACNNGVSENSSIYKISRRDLCCWGAANGPFYSNFAPAAALQACNFLFIYFFIFLFFIFLNFPCRCI